MDRRYFRGWSHPICSVKFCSKKFTMKDFDEKSHITNTSVQLKYHDISDRNLPEHHMLSLSQLNVIFEHMGKPNAYYDIIYPEMKRVIKYFTKESYEHIEHRPGRYQLFGYRCFLFYFFFVTIDLVSLMLYIILELTGSSQMILKLTLLK